MQSEILSVAVRQSHYNQLGGIHLCINHVQVFQNFSE